MAGRACWYVAMAALAGACFTEDPDVSTEAGSSGSPGTASASTTGVPGTGSTLALDTGSGTDTAAPTVLYYRQRLGFNIIPAEGIEDFPALVLLNQSRIDYSLVAPGGADLRFYDAAERTLLPHEIESWDPSGTSLVWVRVPEIGIDGPENIWMRYAEAAPTTPEPSTDVWSNAYVAVWHLPSADDSGPLGLHGAFVPGTATTASSEFGTGAHFGTGESLRVEQMAGLDLDDAITISAWAFPEATTRGPTHRSVVHKGPSYRLVAVDSTAGVSLLTVGRTAGGPATASGPALATQWYDLFATYARDEAAILYVDGVATLGTNGGGIPILPNTVALEVGSDPFEGSVDEVRLASVARSAAWVDLQHESMTDILFVYDDAEPIFE